MRAALRSLDLVVTYGGGPPVINAYEEFGAARCVPIYNGLDPATHHPVPANPAFAADLAFLANRLPDREARVQSFFLEPAATLPGKRFLLGGNGWDDKPMSGNITRIGHVPTRDHNAFNCSPLAVLNVARDSMAAVGFSPATRVFEAAGAGTCLITDAWEGIELFLAPDEEVLVARDGRDVADHLAALTPERARAIGQRALARALADHTYDRRALELFELLTSMLQARAKRPHESASSSGLRNPLLHGLVQLQTLTRRPSMSEITRRSLVGATTAGLASLGLIGQAEAAETNQQQQPKALLGTVEGDRVTLPPAR